MNKRYQNFPKWMDQWWWFILYVQILISRYVLDSSCADVEDDVIAVLPTLRMMLLLICQVGSSNGIEVDKFRMPRYMWDCM